MSIPKASKIGREPFTISTQHGDLLVTPTSAVRDSGSLKDSVAVEGVCDETPPFEEVGSVLFMDSPFRVVIRQLWVRDGSQGVRVEMIIPAPRFWA
jgi:hypothetical protein